MIKEPGVKKQKTMLQNLQHAGRVQKQGKSNESDSSVDLDEVIQQNKARVQEAIKSNLLQRLNITKETEDKKKKKGVVKVAAQGLLDVRVKDLKMVTDLFSWEQLQQSERFVVKTYKDSFYAGELG